MRKASCIIIGAFLLLFCVISSLSWLVPLYVNSRLVPDLKTRYDLPGLAMHVSHFGPHELVVESLTLAGVKGIDVQIDSLSCSYSLFNLVTKREIERCTVRGARMELSQVGAGEEVAAGQSAFSPGDDDENEAWQLPVTIKSIILQNAHLIFGGSEGPVDLPLSLSLAMDGPLDSFSELPFALQLETIGQSGTARGRVNLASHSLNLQYGLHFNLGPLAHFAGLASVGPVEGKMDFSGDFAGNYAPFSITRLESRQNPLSLGIQYGDWHLATRTQPEGGEPVLSLNLQPDNKVQIILPELQINGPADLNVRNPELDIDPQAGRISAALLVSTFSSPDSGKEQESRLQGDLALAFSYDFREARWSVESVSQDGEDHRAATFVLPLGGGIKISAPLVLTLNGHGTGDSAAVRASGHMPLVNFVGDSLQGRAEKIGFEIDIAARMEKSLLLADLNYSASLPLLSLTSGQGVQGQTGVNLKGNARFDGQHLEAQGRVQLIGGVVKMPEQEIELSGIFSDIPVHYPLDLASGKEDGSFRVDRVSFRKKQMASFKGAITRQGKSYLIAADIRDTVLDGAQLKVSGRADMLPQSGEPALEAELRLEPHRLDQFSLKSLGLEQEVMVSGLVHANAHASFERGRFAGEATIGMEEGDLTLPEKAIAVSGISTALSFDDLPTLRSLPARLRFSSAKAGEYGFGEGVVDFQLEPGDTLLVEKGSFKWSGGTVHALAMRLPLKGTEFAADLYCDRLNLAELLRQFGIDDVSGEGSVNGRIPVSFKGGKFLFEDGFLYSTPGGGGNIRVKALDLLTAGVPKNSPQFAQLDFASAALSNFAYNWVKLSLASEGEDVVLKMNLDGRPAKPLPFSFDQKSGTFNRLKVSSEKGIDQPIVLDVNFRIPFNELLGYGKSIKQVIDLMQ